MRAHEGAKEDKKSFSLISDERLVELYATMLKCRMIEERLPGQHGTAKKDEASAVGVAINLMKADSVHATAGAWRPQFIRGAPLKDLLAEQSAAANGLGLDASFDRATEQARAHKANGKGAIAVAFASSEHASARPWEKTLKHAAKHNLPILLVCQNGAAGGKTPTRKTARSMELSLRAQQYGLPWIVVDGHDVVAVYRVACEAITHARKGNGPTLIDCQSWNVDGAPDAILDHDPIVNMEKYLEGKGLFKRQLRTRISAGFRKSLDAALGTAGAPPLDVAKR